MPGAARCSARPSGAPIQRATWTRRCAGWASRPRETLDVATLSSHPGADSLGLNDIARLSLRCASELVFDPYVENRTTGAFILIDETSNDTVGAGMIADVRCDIQRQSVS